jgi:hypothetical protein
MECYWKARIEAPSVTPEPPPLELRDDSITSEYDRLRRSCLLPNNQDNGWEAELRQYLKDFVEDVTKDTDIVLWWQVRKYSSTSCPPVMVHFRTVDIITRPCTVWHLTSCHVRHHPFLVNASFLVEGRSRQRDEPG